MYHKWKGFGFIEVAQKGIVPNDRLFVHWKQLQSDDRFPFLQKDMEVEFGLSVQREFFRGTQTVKAKEVSMVGGMSIVLQDDLDAAEKEFVGGQHLRYTGTLKFFTPRHGFGYVVMDQGYDVDPAVPSELRVETSEVNSGGKEPRFMQNLAVEFGIWKTLRGGYKVYNMTLPGGHPLTQDALENRISMGPQAYHGEVVIWNWRQGWGFIRLDPSTTLPPRVNAKLAQQHAAARSRGKNITNDKMMYFRRPDCAPMAMIQQGMRVQFQLYIDDKGAGACDVRG
jgi:cold shock CspA family protein